VDEASVSTRLGSSTGSRASFRGCSTTRRSGHPRITRPAAVAMWPKVAPLSR
jgi:hypothetical protein